MLTIDDFKRAEIRAGTIRAAERVPDTDKLVKLSVDLGEESPRTIVSGIADRIPDIAALVGEQCLFVANLEPRVIRGIESNGMILALAGEGFFSLAAPKVPVPPGTKAN